MTQKDKKLNCLNCRIGDFKHSLCDCHNGFCAKYKGIGTQEDFFMAIEALSTDVVPKHDVEIIIDEITKRTSSKDMAIEALSKPNYESDNEVRLAVTNRNKEKVILWDAFGEVEYYPNGEINCVYCPRYYETEDDIDVHSHCRSHGRLIDADALLNKLPKVYYGSTIHLLINDAPTISTDRPQGEWIDKGDDAECSICGAHSGTQFDGVEPIPLKTKFCHNCGARMKGNENE